MGSYTLLSFRTWGEVGLRDQNARELRRQLSLEWTCEQQKPNQDPAGATPERDVGGNGVSVKEVR